MAITHNFKEGIDWVADATGETPLANHIFVSKDSTSTEDGSPQNPYNTLSAAVSAAVSNDTIVVGAGVYTAINLDLQSKGLNITGDGYVIFNGNGLDEGLTMQLNTVCKNIIFRSYGSFPCIRGTFSAVPIVEQCLIIDSKYSDDNTTFTSGVQLNNCKLINAVHGTTSGNHDSSANGSIFINSNIINNTTSGKQIKNCHFDSSSIIIAEGDCDFIFNNNNGTLFFNSSGLNSNNINVNASFNNEVGFDLSVTASSQLIGSGENASNIGNVFIAKGLFKGVSELDIGIDANVNVGYNSLGEIELQAGAAAAETFETAEEEALELSVLGATRISGFPDLVNNTPDNNNALVNPNQLVLEINVALLDGIYTGWKEYRWNEQPTQNADGTPNGDSSYDWADNNKVPYKKRKFRITVRNDYNQA